MDPSVNNSVDLPSESILPFGECMIYCLNECNAGACDTELITEGRQAGRQARSGHDMN